MELERTDISNQFFHGMIQAIRGEGDFPKDPISAEDEMFYRLGELTEDNTISEQEAIDCFAQYIKSVRPDVRVIHLGQTVSKPFYE